MSHARESLFIPYPHRLVFGTGRGDDVSFGRDSDGGFSMLGDVLSFMPGSARFVDGTNGSDSNNGGSWAEAYATIQAAIDAASAGDRIYIAPGDYDEAVTISKNYLTLMGMGGRGSVAIAPSASNAIALSISGASARTKDVTLINIGGEGNGTGGGLRIFGDIRRIRAIACKFEGGAFGGKLESTAAGSVGDTRLIDCEFAWATTALHLTASGGGDPVTQTLLQNSLLHNFTADGVLTSVSHAADLWILDNTFANQEDGTEPTQYLDIDDASTTGLVSGNKFATTVLASAKLALASGVIFAGNFAQAEGPATGGGTAGRPD